MSEPTKTSIGSYSVTGKLPGRGEDYHATSPEGTRVLVRLVAGGEALEQVRREVAACSTLDHPAIARALDTFETDGKLALVFEHFEGTSLGQIMKRPGPRRLLSPAAVWLVVHEITGALGQAHSASDSAGDLVAVCHGHLAPDWILVSPSGAVRLEGLGLAALVGGESLSADAGYQAPEQAKGGRVTPRGDLYAAAALLWAMLSGEDPTPSAPPSLSTIREQVPDELREALERALQPSVGKRKITSMELEQALGEVVDEAAGRQALSAAARSAVQSPAAPADTGPAMLGLMGRPTAGSEPDPAELGPAPVEAAPASPTPSPAVAKAKAIGARSRKSSVRSRQKTLLGAFGAPQPAPAAGGPRQAVARKSDEAESADAGASAPVGLGARPADPPRSRRSRRRRRGARRRRRGARRRRRGGVPRSRYRPGLVDRPPGALMTWACPRPAASRPSRRPQPERPARRAGRSLPSRPRWSGSSAWTARTARTSKPSRPSRR